jgi:hypothetical protein
MSDSDVQLDEDLAKRALEARRRSGGLVAESDLLVDLSDKLRAARAGEVSIVRCAWCERFQVAQEWLDLEAIGRGQQHVRGALLERASHGICPECLRQQPGATHEPRSNE